MSAVSSTNSLYQQLAAESSGASSNSSNQPDPNSTDALANQSAFLQLLVAQLKNQDPTQPVDGTTFVTQLAEFSDVEQNLAMRQDLDAMSIKYDGTNSLTPSTTAASSSTSGADDSGSTTNSSNGNNGTSGTGATGS